MKSVLYLCEKDFPRLDVAKKALYMAASSMIYSDYKNNLMDVYITRKWIGIPQCLENIHQTILGKPISHKDSRAKIREHTATVPDKEFNSIFERIFM